MENNKKSEEEKKTRNAVRTLIGLALLIVVLILFFSSFFIVRAGFRGVVLTWGMPSNIAVAEGLHVKMPIMQSVVMIDVKTLKYSVKASAASNDLQHVTTTVAVNYHVVPEKAPEIYQKIGVNYQETVINPTVEESLKATTALFNAEELITKRETVKHAYEKALRDRLVARGIMVETISITDFQFSTEFAKAIEDKVVARQRKQQAEVDKQRIMIEAQSAREKAVGEANASRERAKGEADAINTLNSQLAQSPLYLKWMAINKWDGKMPLVTGGGAVPMIDLNTLKQ